MKSSADELVITAERVHSEEITARMKIETCENKIVTLYSERNWLEKEISECQAEINAASLRTDSEGNPSPDYNAIASAKSRMSIAYTRCSQIDIELTVVQRELEEAKNHLIAVQLEKVKTLKKIQEKVETNNTNLDISANIGFDFMPVGMDMYSVMKNNLRKLSSAASLLGGNAQTSTKAYSGSTSKSSLAPNTPSGSNANNASTGDNSLDKAHDTANVHFSSPVAGFQACRVNKGALPFGKRVQNNPLIKQNNGFDSIKASQNLGSLFTGNESDSSEKNRKGLFGGLFKKNKNNSNDKKNMGAFCGFPVDEHGFVKTDDAAYNAFMGIYNNYTEDASIIPTNGDNSIEIINPLMIQGYALSRHEVEEPGKFWSMHDGGGTKGSFLQIAEKIPEVKSRLDAGESLSSLEADEELGACASLYFDPLEMPRVVKCHGYYEFQGNGRHRIIAAALMGYDIPVMVTGIRPKPITKEDIAQFNEFRETLGDMVPDNVGDFVSLRDDFPEDFDKVKTALNIVRQYNVIGSVTTSTIVDLDKQVHKSRCHGFDISGIKGKMRQTIKDLHKSGNAAVMLLDGETFFAHSRVNKTDSPEFQTYRGELKLVGLKEENRQFKVHYCGNRNIPREYDTEAKFLEYVADIKNPTDSFEITILSQKPICKSCLGVVSQFCRKFPNAKVNIISGKVDTNKGITTMRCLEGGQ